MSAAGGSTAKADAPAREPPDTLVQGGRFAAAREA
jgi:hypothetical protein